MRIGDDFEDLGRVAGIKFGAGGVTIEGTAGNSDLFITSDECVNRPAPKVLDADGVEIRVGDTVWGVSNGIEFTVAGLPKSMEYQAVKLRLDDGAFTGLDPDQLIHTKPEPPKRCRDCAHWQKDPTADNMGVCWFFYHEYEGEDCYAARRADIGACEEFIPRAKALAGVSE